MSEKDKAYMPKDDDGQPDEEDVMASWLPLFSERRALEQKWHQWEGANHPTGTDLKYKEDAQASIKLRLAAIERELKDGPGDKAHGMQSVPVVNIVPPQEPRWPVKLPHLWPPETPPPE